MGRRIRGQFKKQSSPKLQINFRETFATLNTALKSMKWFWVTLLFIREFNKINISLNSIFFKP